MDKIKSQHIGLRGRKHSYTKYIFLVLKRTKNSFYSRTNKIHKTSETSSIIDSIIFNINKTAIILATRFKAF